MEIMKLGFCTFFKDLNYVEFSEIKEDEKYQIEFNIGTRIIDIKNNNIQIMYMSNFAFMNDKTNTMEKINVNLGSGNSTLLQIAHVGDTIHIDVIVTRIKKEQLQDGSIQYTIYAKDELFN